ncbi:MAG: hypothetical protein RI556_11530 [Hydrogenovibrio sp.]|uniref:hypothetical protein n=1 Tax=Hydrogenovibrio sp. TaxID=2065821 RepID=UPI00286FF323|nr:hypothetical protein [Hydrogenovibrio sp.]MDR9499798.1 hypothetical protein [Hydrogenovibrio sp.]
MMTKIKTLLVLFSLLPGLLFAEANHFQLRDMPLHEVAKLTSEKTKYSLIVPANLDGSISFFKGLDLSPVDFKDFLLGSLRVNGLDYEIKGRQIFVKKESDTIVFKNYYSEAYQTALEGVDLSSFLDEEGRYSAFKNYHLVYASPDQHQAIKHFLGSIKKENESLTSRVLHFEDVDPQKIKTLDFGEDVQMVFDEKTRKLLVYGPTEKTAEVAATLRHLDRPQQTYNVSLIIASVSRSNLEKKGFGFAFQQGGFSLDLVNSVFGFSSVADATQAISAFAEYLDSQSTSSVVSRPYMQILDGAQASISSGKEIPFVKSTVDQTTGQTIQAIERKNVGLNLTVGLTTITAHKISLSIRQRLSSLSATQLQGVSDVVTDNQSISTTIHVQPGRFYAFGGLVDKRTKESESTGLLTFRDSADTQGQEITVFVYVSPTDRPTASLGATVSPWWE